MWARLQIAAHPLEQHAGKGRRILREPPQEEMSEIVSKKLGLFEAFGVELEYMIVASGSLNVMPICDRLIEAECGRIESEIERGSIAWSNELVLHVVELKTAAPSPTLLGLHQQFQDQIRQINRRLNNLGGRLMPSAMHPWMDPFRDMKLWPHEYSVVYEAFNRIFDCRGHGWANLQSVHLNLPFANDEEFGRLHAAIRLVLPLLPAIAAASPIVEGRVTGRMDNRLNVYRTNSQKIPMIAGKVIPEQAFSESEYHRQIFEPLFRDIAPHDPDNVLRDEFLNARGAIARFSRGAIEIRVIDIQECPAADLAVLQATVGVLKALVSERWSSLEAQQAVTIEPLYEVLLAAIDKGDQAIISNPDLLRLYGVQKSSCTLNELWQTLYSATDPDMDVATRRAFETILDKGPLARRMTKALARDNSILRITEVAQELCDCLSSGRQFSA